MSHKVALNFADGKTVFLNVRPDEVLLDAALRNGISLPFDCREGVCGTCQGRCETGCRGSWESCRQDYVHDEVLSADDLAQGKVLFCQTRVLSDAVFYVDVESGLCHAGGVATVPAVVRDVRLISENTAILHLDASGHGRQLDYLPGQYARIEVPGAGVWRSYSFASQPNPANRLQFLIRLLPDGVMSHYLRTRCRSGQSIRLEAPLGAFYLRRVERPLVMAAGGTGLSAFLGMLDQLAGQGGCGQPVRLLYGVTHESDLCELDRLRAYCDRIADFSFETVVMRPGVGWPGRRGVIADHLAGDLRADGVVDLYVCGPPPMVESIRRWLTQNRPSGTTRLYCEKFADGSSGPSS